MYTNKCIKCGKEFETKNPKRVICPECLYPEKGAGEPVIPSDDTGNIQDYSRGYSAGTGNPQGYNNRQNYGQERYNSPRPRNNNFQRRDNNNFNRRNQKL